MCAAKERKEEESMDLAFLLMYKYVHRCQHPIRTASLQCPATQTPVLISTTLFHPHPTFSAPGTGFVEDNFSTEGLGEWLQDDSST